jgi:antirestriction protein
MIKGFITNLGKYNEGYLVGEWIEFPISDDELEAVYERIGINEEYEEIFFTDWECEVDAEFGEYEQIERINELAEALGNADVEKIKAIIEADGGSLENALDCEDNVTFYEGMDMEDVAREIVESCYDFPEFALRYFDYEAFARDLSFDGYTEVSNGVVFRY